RRRPVRRPRRRGPDGDRRCLVRAGLHPAGGAVGVSRPGAPPRPVVPGRRRPAERPPGRPRAAAVLGPDRRVLPGPPAAARAARRRLPERLGADVARRTGRALDAGSDPGWLWKGRRVYVYDGSHASMPDTPANQAEYPQPDTQKPGLGFPLARLAAVFSLACGAGRGLAIRRYPREGQSGLWVLP